MPEIRRVLKFIKNEWQWFTIIATVLSAVFFGGWKAATFVNENNQAVEKASRAAADAQAAVGTLKDSLADTNWILAQIAGKVGVPLPVGRVTAAFK